MDPNAKERDTVFQQSRMSMGLFIGAILFATTVQWMLLDMYIPALPVLKEEFGVSEGMLNFTLNTGIFASAAGTLIGGMLSDKYGRKPLLMASFIVASAGLFAAAASSGVIFLSVMRGVIGLSSGFIMAITTAQIRDSYCGRKFQKTMSLQQALAVAGPMVSPAIGSFVIEYMSWRWIFIVLGAANSLSMIPFIFSDETWPEVKRTANDIGTAVKEMMSIVRFRAFDLLMAIILIISIPMWSYIAVSSYVYYDIFDVSNIKFSILYACGSGMSLVATFAYMWLSSHMKNRAIMWMCMLFLGISSALMMIFGSIGPIAFYLCLIPLVLAEGMVRPLGMVVALDAHADKAGSASALTNFAINIIGVLATSLATLGWESFITGISVITGCCALASLPLIIIMARKKYRDYCR